MYPTQRFCWAQNGDEGSQTAEEREDGSHSKGLEEEQLVWCTKTLTGLQCLSPGDALELGQADK